ncbi:phenylacetate--CoA ligase family protein [Planococcus sp. CAU13]|uniref:phenylacetate--CoA ligase family protein n=1 Tax=Planococcus sp. CAU13 TaxID=1541197 RepID=UPI00052FEEB5|nr:phenylacetate--CoA ligase family protein [Planococcus sp. CAU13]
MRNLQSQIYENMPIFFQNALTSWNGYRKTRSRYGSLYYSFLIELEKQQYLNEHHAKNYQARELQQLLRYVMEKSPFYMEFYKQIDIEKIRTIEDMRTLPVLDKETLAQNIHKIYTVTEQSAAEIEVSAEKGNALKIFYTKEDVQKKKAFLDFFKKQHGAINLEMKRASFNSQRIIPENQNIKIFWRDNYFVRQRIYSSFYCTEENAAAYIENLEKYKPDFIDGLPSAIYELAKYINRNKLILSFKPAAIFPVAESIPPRQRKEIEEAFDCPMRDRYSSAAAAPFIMECVKGRMHYNLYSGIIESTDEGKMIVTSFNSYGTPLIRYDSGNKVELAEMQMSCECGSVHPVIEKIVGRPYQRPSAVSKGNFSVDGYPEPVEKFPGTLNKFLLFRNF